MTSIPTPPSTTISTPSPTERPEPDMPPPASARPIYLIVATSRNPALGIGLRGSLPWPAIKSDMSFFQRVTRDSRPARSGKESINAVVMGRKTYDSIPPRFRPLAGRLNIVVSRTPVRKLADSIINDIKRAKDVEMGATFTATPSEDTILLGSTPKSNTTTTAPVLVSSSIEAALAALEGKEKSLAGKSIGNIFIIGGTQIYQSFLDLTVPEVRILQTQIRKTDGGDFECDTFFPTSLSQSNEFRAVSDSELSSWLRKGDGEAVIALPQGDSEWDKDDKAGVELKVVGWERA